MILLLLCLAITAQAAQVLYWGILANTTVQYQNGSTTLLNQFDYDTQVNTSRIGLYDSSLNFVDFIEFYQEYGHFDEHGNWHSDFTPPEYYLDGTVEYDLNPQMGIEGRGNSAELEDSNESMYVRMEIGYEEIFLIPGGDPNNDGDWDYGEFQLFAHTDFITVGELISENHTYYPGSIAPPTQTPWYPTIFYVDEPIPEPSMFILTLLGVCAILLRRGNVEQI